MFGRRKTIKYLEDKVELLNSRMRTVSRDVDRLERILKYSKNGEVTYNLIQKLTHRENPFKHGPIIIQYFTSLYIYKDKCEYVIELKELNDKTLHRDTAVISYDDKFYHFSIKADAIYYTFIIDPYSGKYIFKTDKAKEGEVEKCTDC